MTSTATRRGRCVDLFAGAGGLSLGAEQAGFDILVSADDKPWNAETHRDNFGYGRSLALDLSADRSREIRRALASFDGRGDEPDMIAMGEGVDAVIGGPPCQGISVIGSRLADDPRNRLMVGFVDHVAALGARYGIMEQVPALLSAVNERLLDELREHLRMRGYGLVAPRTLRAIDFGVPQRRERAFLLIHRQDQAAPAYPEPTHGVGDMLLRAVPTVADALDALPDADDHPELLDRHWMRIGHPAPTTRYGRLMRGLENDVDDLSYPRRRDADLLTCSQLARHGAASVARFAATRPGGSEPVSRRHRLDPHGTSLTLRAGSDAAHGSFTSVVPIHPKGTRTITVREAARLHGMPDHVRLSPVKITGYRQVGGSVPPPLARVVAAAVMTAAGLAPAAPTASIEEIADRRAA